MKEKILVSAGIRGAYVGSEKPTLTCLQRRRTSAPARSSGRWREASIQGAKHSAHTLPRDGASVLAAASSECARVPVTDVPHREPSWTRPRLGPRSVCLLSGAADLFGAVRSLGPRAPGRPPSVFPSPPWATCCFPLRLPHRRDVCCVFCHGHLACPSPGPLRPRLP